jgi:Protein of unknown function (DUF2997)
MQEIIMEFFPNGEDVTITTKGFKGKACKAATKPIEDALGVVVKDTDTPEMHQVQEQQVKARG